MTRQLPLLAFSLASVALAACSAPDDSVGSDSQNIDQTSGDVTVLKVTTTWKQIHISNGSAVTTGEAPNDPAFDSSKCTDLGKNQLDCTKAFESAFGAPALHDIILSHQVARCRVVEIQTVSSAAAVDASDGIGAYYGYDSGPRSSERLLPKANLAKVGDAKFKDGTKAVVHAFVGLGACDIGGRWGAASFKPYMQFTASDDGRQYKNWDDHADYRIEDQTRSFDRSAELLQ
jgi:hypothetical protein